MKIPPAGEVARSVEGESPADLASSPSVVAPRRHLPRWGEDVARHLVSQRETLGFAVLSKIGKT
ncbi:hypothetical protein CSW59_06275 [Caulobacter sp. BP25]|nr:hypothetical protein CSW59_06275 [Caulobacter sp. BP25]